MSDKKRIHKPSPVSGFPEWLPEIRAVEQRWFDHIRKTFELYGFCNIETPSVETLEVIQAKGGDGQADTDKEVYVLERLHKEEGDKDARLALHFDQTVPLARYVAQHFNDLTFPFKRYQMQRVWRGERPQAGRFREFYQCDIDVINVDNMPMHFDAEMPAIMWEILSSLPGMESENIQIRISNRKILIGLLEGLDTTNIAEIMRIIDKLDKIGEETVLTSLSSEAGMNKEQIAQISQLLSLRKQGSLNGIKQIPAFAGNTTMQEGIEELSFVMDQLSHLPEGAVVADLSIVRGLDYYTGTVYETVFVDDPAYGSICSGGRYDDLASSYINKSLPGVGISIGFSRLFDRLRLAGKLPDGRKSPADVLMVLPSEDRREIASKTAQYLRARGIKVEQFHAPQKVGKQMGYAEKKGIPFVWFPPFSDDKEHEVKDMNTGEQIGADPDTWEKP